MYLFWIYLIFGIGLMLLAVYMAYQVGCQAGALRFVHDLADAAETHLTPEHRDQFALYVLTLSTSMQGQQREHTRQLSELTSDWDDEESI